jgi:hypothetical protein
VPRLSRPIQRVSLPFRIDRKVQEHHRREVVFKTASGIDNRGLSECGGDVRPDLAGQ